MRKRPTRMQTASYWLLLGCGLLGFSVSVGQPVNPAAPMNPTLVRLINQMDAMMPLIDEAKAEQNPTARVTFHFDTWRDSAGQQHDGFRQSLLRMRQALVDQINQPSLTPAVVTPLTDDFVGR